ncbi:MAG: nuclear transport factor 2 family protein [Parvularculaceae bacterium]|nr:nuclear transport factor 2 family protein [Parvularculaceae bacterium]
MHTTKRELDGERALEGLLKRDRMRECIVRLARGEDRRDADLIKTAFWPNATVDFGVFAGTFAEYLAWVVPGSPALPTTQHVLGQSFFDLHVDHALVETQVVSYHRVDMGKEHRDTCIGGRYLDRFELRHDDWRIASRTMLYDWSQDWGVAADFSKGVMGLAFSSPKFAGRAHGDWSETFFGKSG